MIFGLIYAYVFDKIFIYQLLASLVTYCAIKVVRFFNYRTDRYKIFKEYGIPGPKPSILGGSLDEYSAAEAFHLKDEEMLKKYGNFYGVYFGDEASVITTDLDILKRLFLEEQSAFTERTRHFFDQPIMRSVLFAKYPRWRLMRKVMSPYFSMFTVRGESSSQFVEHTLKLMLEYIDTKVSAAEATGKRALLDIQSLLKSTALHLISTMAIKLPNVQVIENDENVKHLDEYLDFCNKGMILWAVRFPVFEVIIEFLSKNFEYNKTLSLIARCLNNIIDRGLEKLSTISPEASSKKSTDQVHVIDNLVKLHQEGTLSRVEVIGNAEAILLAGYETSSTTLAYIFWVLARMPDIQSKLRSDLMAYGTDSKYLDQVINETMRIYPTVINFTTRIANRTLEVNGWTIPKGARLVYHSWLIHRNPDVWPEPEKFDPERFNQKNEIHPCAFAPFGLGDRKCLGMQLALLEIRMIVCDIILRYKLYLKSPQKLELLTSAGVLTKSKEKILVELERL